MGGRGDLAVVDLRFAGGAAGVEDEERILRPAPLGLALVRRSAHQRVPTQVHLGVPRDLDTHTHKARYGRRRSKRQTAADFVK